MTNKSGPTLPISTGPESERSVPQPAARVSEFAMQHVNAMRVAQARIYEGDARYYIVTANGYVVRGPFPTLTTAEVALDNLRERVREELSDG